MFLAMVAQAQTTFDLSTDFSLRDNPNKVWQYGYSATNSLAPDQFRLDKQDGFLTIWWDRNAKLYFFLACFNNPNGPCRMRGTGHWEGDSFVNDYEETVKGKRTSWRDSFTFAPSAHTLVAAMEADGGAMRTQITTSATRRVRSSGDNGK
jgi:hypothetical protein